MEKIAVVYWSGTGNTEAMANAVKAGAEEKGAEVELFQVPGVSADSLSGYQKLAFGCPSMGDEVLEESEFEPFFESVEGSLSGKKVALFGSYGWGDGQWMRDWEDRVRKSGASLIDDGKIATETGDEAEYKDFGGQIAAS